MARRKRPGRSFAAMMADERNRWTPEALAASLHMAMLVDLVQCANDNGRRARSPARR